MKKLTLFGWSVTCVAALALVLSGTPTAVAGERFNQAGKGLLNITTFWLEVPGCMVDVSQKKNPWLGCSWGLLKGIAFMPLRLEQGMMEFLTSPIAPHQPKTTSIGPKTTFGYFTGETSEPTGQPIAQPAVQPPTPPEPRPLRGK
ncbi:MAG: hypothetical protein HZA91_09800 [Verrucomicrobia bacterium]|nr:hypothetical protein [Verrucomicrobiota bacterium]